MSLLLRSALVSAPDILVADLWPVSLLIGFVFHDLQPTIRQEHAVRALSMFVLSAFLLAKFASRLGILDFVGVLVVSWLLFSRQAHTLLIVTSTENTKQHIIIIIIIIIMRTCSMSLYSVAVLIKFFDGK
jgi:hypothetical protein